MRSGQPLGRREVLLALLGSMLLAAALNWRSVLHPTSTIPQDLGDSMYFLWQVGWLGHASHGGLGDLWTTNAFSGAPGNLAYTDVMVGYLPIAAITSGVRSATLAYNLIFLFLSGLALFGGYLLARALGSNVPGALVCAAAFGLAPWRLAHERHPNVISIGGLALALALLALGNRWRLNAENDSAATSLRRRLVLVAAGWLVACWQLSLGFAIGIPFFYVVLALTAATVLALLVRQPDGWKSLLAANSGGVLAFVLCTYLLSRPYVQVLDAFPGAQRTSGQLLFHSPHASGFLTAPGQSLLYGQLTTRWREGLTSPIEQAVFPGLLVVLLALVGLAVSSWTPRRRLALAAVTVVAGVLALGVYGPWGGHLYLLLFDHLPGWNASRTPGRLVVWVSLGLGLLAAGLVTRVTQERAGRRAAALALLPAVLVATEGLGVVPHPRVPTAPVALARFADPLLVLPIDRVGDYRVMAWSMDGWPVLANGGSGYDPPFQAELRDAVQDFPSATSVAYLRERGVRTVVVDLRSTTGPALVPAGVTQIYRSATVEVFSIGSPA